MLTFKSQPDIPPSFAESKIMKHLDGLHIPYHREVSFNKSLYRYDFYLPVHNLIIEYDGKEWHNSDQSKKRDGIKNKLANDLGIKLIRIQGLNLIKYLFTEPPKSRPKGKVKIIAPKPDKIKTKKIKPIKPVKPKNKPFEAIKKKVVFTPKPLIRFGRI